MQNVQFEGSLGETRRDVGVNGNGDGHTTAKVQTGDAVKVVSRGERRRFVGRGFRVVLLVAVASLVAAGVKAMTRKWWDKPQAAAVQASTAIAKQDSKLLPDFGVAPGQIKSSAKKDEEPLYLRGYSVRGLTLNVVLSDGSLYTEADKELTEVQRNYVVISGVKYRLRLLARSSETRDKNQMQEPKDSLASPVVPASQGGQVFGSWIQTSDGVLRLIDRSGLSH